MNNLIATNKMSRRKPQNSSSEESPKRHSSRSSEVTHATDILASVLSKYGLDRKVKEYQFVADWEQIVGSEIARRSRPEKLYKGTLFVKVMGSAWAQELSFHKATIIRRVAKYLNRPELVKDIRFLVDSSTNSVSSVGKL